MIYNNLHRTLSLVLILSMPSLLCASRPAAASATDNDMIALCASLDAQLKAIDDIKFAALKDEIKKLREENFALRNLHRRPMSAEAQAMANALDVSKFKKLAEKKK